MKSRNVGVLPIALLTILAVTTVVYAGMTGSTASEVQEAVSVQVADETANATQSEADLTAQQAGIAVCFFGRNQTTDNTKETERASNFASQQALDAAEAAKKARREKEASWEGRAIANHVEEYVYIRETASESGTIVGKLPKGAAGDVVEKDSEWTLLSSGEVEGYVNNDYLAFDAEALAVAESVCTYVATVEIDNASVLECASEEAQKLDTASTGDVLEVVEENGSWVKVLTSNCVGYMSGSAVSIELAVGEAVPISSDAEAGTETETPAETEDTGTSEARSESDTSSDNAPQAEETETADVQETIVVSEAETQTSASASETDTSTESTSGAEGTHSATFKVTAYCSCAACCGSYSNGATATGTTVTAGRTIAVDTSVIPLGTTVYIDGVAYVAEDTGVSGYTIDLYMDSHAEALQWGVRYCTVTW